MAGELEKLQGFLPIALPTALEALLSICYLIAP
jgi:hypothetical protein